MQISIGASGRGGISTAGERYSVHDLLFDDIDADAYKGFGAFVAIGSIAPPLKDVPIDQVTAFPPRVLFSLMAPQIVPSKM